MHYNQFGYINTLQQYQSLSGQDLHSVSKEVNFVSATNLHLDGSSNGDLDLAGIPLTEVTDDIDGNPRNPLYPYMGADEPDIVLPVELVSFTFQIDERNVILKWTTSSEENNSGFEIQRNQNQSEWKVIGFSESNGNSTSPEDYAFTDNNLNSGKYGYRLKQIDFNGSFKYYNLNNEVVINVPEKYSLFQNYPNPFNPKTTINYQIPAAINVTMKVFDISGKEISTLVNEKKEAGFYSVDFDGTDLSSGTYIYTLQAGDFVSTRRMIVIK
ncbi:MAG: T9SS type A sorting domain-containing protein [Ignavibacteria bacterium]|nr:T9SS type A sorting domain-containing protein [Ignavibacteria bacterium]